jgi:hypothetical protein
MASFASISASRSSLAIQDAMIPSFPDMLWKIDFRTDGGSVDDVSDEARARSSYATRSGASISSMTPSV